MKKIIIFLIFVFPIIASSQNRYKLILDQNFSSTTGANNLLTVHKSIYEIEGLYFKPVLFNEDIFIKKTAGIFYRFSKTVLLDNAIDHMIILSQHEIFGHGGRYREFGYKDASYHFNLAPPYGDGSGWAYSGPVSGNRLVSKHESITRTLSGNTANTILSDELAFTWMMRGSIHYRESYLYLASFHNLTAYILGTKYIKSQKPGNDIKAYILDININEGHGKYFYDINDLNRQLLINVFNPFQYFVAYNYTKNYLWNGKETGILPAIKISSLQYIPSFHLELSPFGSEFYFDNYLKQNDMVCYVYYRQGENTFHSFSGGGLRIENIFNNNFISVGAKGDLWDQPSMILGGDKFKNIKAGIGGALAISVHLKVVKGNHDRPAGRYPFNVFAQTGYKTAGYLKDESLAEKMILRFGLSFDEILK